MSSYYAIQIIGYGKRKCYVIQLVYPGIGTVPTTGKRYRTLEQAQQAAADNGYQIEKIGDCYQII